jgi:dienelactone hydrolase
MRGVLVAAALAVLTAACAAVPPSSQAPNPIPAPIPPGGAPTTLTAIARPDGATDRAHGEWYWAPALDGHAVTLSVYRPDVVALDAASAPVTVLVLNGGDGFRRLYEDLANRYAAQGFIAIAGCWFQAAGPPPNADEIACQDAPTWKGMNATSVEDVDALVTAAEQVPGVDPHRLVVAGHSYGAGVALLRAASGHDEPVIASSGFVASSPLGTAQPLPTDQFATDHAGSIHAPVLILHSATGIDFITPPGQAHALQSALTAAGNPPTAFYFPSPAGHAFPWQPPFDVQYTTDATNWIHSKLP